MKQIYITNIKIDSVRHLKDINIPLFGEKRKNLIMLLWPCSAWA